MSDGGGPAVLAEGLVKHYDGPRGHGRGRPRRGPRGPHRRDLRLPRPQRGRQVDDRADAHDAADDHRPAAPRSPASTSPATPTAPAARSASRCRRPASTRARPAASCWSCTGGCSGSTPARPTERAQELLDAGRARGRRRPRDQGLLRRHAAPARPRGGARARARGPVPRRADHRPRPGEPADGLGGAAPDQRRRHDGLPHDAVPRGGRPALRPPRDHRRRPDRARGHARASSRPTCASAAATARSRRSTTCSSTRPAAPATAPPARSRR